MISRDVKGSKIGDHCIQITILQFDNYHNTMFPGNSNPNLHKIMLISVKGEFLHMSEIILNGQWFYWDVVIHHGD